MIKKPYVNSFDNKFPKIAVSILLLIVSATIFAGIISPYPKDFIDSDSIMLPPSATHLLGTDNLGRDVLTMVLYGGRISLSIGGLSGLIATVIAVVYGTSSGLLGKTIDNVMMRTVELFMSIPSILVVIFLQTMWGKPSVISMSVIIGVTSWMNMSKMVRSEVRQIGSSDYVLAAKTMGASFAYILKTHLLPGFIPVIMFMVISNFSQAIILESTLSFFGLGLPLSTISWGSLISMAQTALLTNAWWIIVIPGIMLIVTLFCVTEIGEFIRKKNNKFYNNL